MNVYEKIIGYECIKDELKMCADVLKYPKKYESLGVSVPGGILLYGAPGLGKTLMAKCFIEDAGIKTYREFTIDFFKMDLNSLPKNASSLKFSKHKDKKYSIQSVQRYSRCKDFDQSQKAKGNSIRRTRVNDRPFFSKRSFKQSIRQL